jgi:ABC-type transport system, involved in lipoprotein release, permease component
MSPLKLARLSLTRHRLATFITIIAIGLSVACGGILLRLYQISESRFSAMGKGGDAIVGAKAGGIDILLGSLNGEGSYPEFLPMKLFESLRADQAVTHGDGVTTRANAIESIIPFVYFGEYQNFRVVGTDETFQKRPRSVDTLLLAEGRWFRTEGEVVVGSSIARSQNLKVGDTVQAHPWMGKISLSGEVELKVVGILLPTETQWDRELFASLSQAKQVFDKFAPALAGRSIWGSEVLHYFLVYLKPGGFESLESLVNQRTVGQIVKVTEQEERLKEISGVGKNVGLFVTAFVILLGGLSVCSMLITRFEGMNLQIAVLRAIGYTKKELTQWLVWEGFLLGIMGVILGALVDSIVFPVLRSQLGSALPPADLVTSSILDSGSIWVIAIIATLLAVTIPAIKMSRQDAHSSLRGQ